MGLLVIAATTKSEIFMGGVSRNIDLEFSDIYPSPPVDTVGAGLSSRGTHALRQVMGIGHVVRDITCIT